MIEDSEQLTRLIKSFQRAEERVQNVLNDRRSNTVQKLKINFDTVLNKVDLSLTQETKAWADKDLERGYNEGAKKIGSIPKGQHETRFSKDVVLNPYIEISNKVSKATSDTRQAINKIIDDCAKDGITSVYDVKKAIQKEMFKQNGSLLVEYSNGAKVQLSSYASMCARTERIVSVNTGSFNRCKDLGIDLVRCTKVPGCCPYCRKYEDKIYSISGNDKRFPALYGSEGPLKHGYNIMHPNCRHEFLPFVEKLYTEEEIKDLQKQSNTFTKYSKNDKIFDEYNRAQAIISKQRREYSQYKYMQSQLGEDMPYKTIGGFRRAKRHYDKTYKDDRNVIKDMLRRIYIQSSKCKKEIHKGRQEKHILGANNYQKGKSYLDISIDQCQELVNIYAGTGKLFYQQSGRFNNKEVVKCGTVVGKVKSISGEWRPTKTFIIHYSNQGTHIVPTLKDAERRNDENQSTN